jgi:HEAT repeat protein
MQSVKQSFIGWRGRSERGGHQPAQKQEERAFSSPATAEEAQVLITQLLGEWELRTRGALQSIPSVLGGGAATMPDALLMRERAVQRLAALGPVALEPLIRLLQAERGNLMAIRRGVIAALALGRMGDVRAMPALLAALRDQREALAPVRAAVAGVLGQFKAESAATIYRRTLQNQNGADWQVDTDLLGTLRLETIVEALIGALRDASAETRAAAAGAFIDLCLEDAPPQAPAVPAEEDHPAARATLRAAVGPLIAALKDQEASVRANAAAALGWIADFRATAPLLGSLKDADARCRGAAAQALGMLRTPAALKPLARALADPSSAVRVQVAEAFGELADPLAADLLLDVLKDAEEPLHVRAAAGRALGRLHLSQSLPFLQALLGAPEAALRAAAIEALGLSGFGRSYRWITPFLWRDPDPAVRHAAARAVARLAGGRLRRARWRLRLAWRVSRQARLEALLLLEQQGRMER